MVNPKFRASQFLTKRNTTNYILSLADFVIIWINEITAVDNIKFTKLSKSIGKTDQF